MHMPNSASSKPRQALKHVKKLSRASHVFWTSILGCVELNIGRYCRAMSDRPDRVATHVETFGAAVMLRCRLASEACSQCQPGRNRNGEAAQR